MKTVIWFRRDLRLGDNPALTAALESGLPVEAVYIEDDKSGAHALAGSASHWYLHHCLLDLQKSLAGIGIPLHLRSGSAEQILPAICEGCGATRVCWNRIVDPNREAVDERVTEQLESSGVTVDIFADDCLIMPERAYKKDGGVYRVFTPFWNNLRERLETEPWRTRLCPTPQVSSQPLSCSPGNVEALQLLPRHPWHKKLHDHWQPGEASAHRLLQRFLQCKVVDYERQRDIPSIDGTSRLSPALHFGEISVARVYASCMDLLVTESDEVFRAGIRRFLSEIGWREFARHVLHAFPQTVNCSMNPRFDQRGAWEPDPDGVVLRAWQRGETGIALVDAGMRELWETGWMHNRVRMIVGSLLTKNLGIHWREGARWFENTLVDADVASNTLGWQWVAGCGTDAAPYFRIFNPDTQAKKFDPDGVYLTRWLGDRMQPTPLVDLKASRARALERYQNAIRHTDG